MAVALGGILVAVGGWWTVLIAMVALGAGVVLGVASATGTAAARRTRTTGHDRSTIRSDEPQSHAAVARPTQGVGQSPPGELTERLAAPAGDKGGGASAPPGRPSDAAAAADPAVRDVLQAISGRMAAARVVLWRRGEARLEPVLSTRHPPPSLSLQGQPLAWALDQRQSLRLDEPPVWALGPLAALPFQLRGAGGADGEEGEDVLLSVEVAPHEGAGVEAASADARGERHLGELPPERDLRTAATILARVLELSRREQRVASAHARADRVLDFLRNLSRDPEGGEFHQELADAAVELTGAAGAAVASWEGESGQVLARVGAAGGPAPGTWFGVMEGDLALTARAGSALHRDHHTARPLPLAEPGERWRDRPRYTSIVPLRSAVGETAGLIAAWGPTPPERDGLELLEGLGALLTLQLHHSTHLARFRQRAVEDALTGLANRGALEERIERERRRFHRYRRPVALLVLDLDHFKRINDTYGHPAGDAVLARVADILRAATRETDFPARYGGEELVILMEETMRTQAADVAERIRTTIAETAFQWNDAVLPVSASVGVSACPECVEDPGELMRSADAALYASKEAGRNRVTVAAIRGSGG